MARPKRNEQPDAEAQMLAEPRSHLDMGLASCGDEIVDPDEVTRTAIAQHLMRVPGYPDGTRDPDFSCRGPGCEIRTSRVTDPGVAWNERTAQFHCSQECLEAYEWATQGGYTPRQPSGTMERAAKAGFAERHGKPVRE